MGSIKAQLPGLYSCVQFHSTAEHADLDISNITMLQWYNVYNVTMLHHRLSPQYADTQ